MRPHCRTLSGRSAEKRRSISALSFTLARVFMSSAGEENVAAGFTECIERPLPSRFRVSEQSPKRGPIANRVELGPDLQCRRCEIAARDAAPQILESARIVADVTEEPAFLKDCFGIVEDLQRRHERSRCDHIVG